jgi:hypothetical protein
MTQYVEFKLENGGMILIEAPEEKKGSGNAGFVPASRGGEETNPAAKAAKSFSDSLESVRLSADQLMTKLQGLSSPPDEVEVNFSLKASGELGNLVVGTVGAEANYNVKIKWAKDKPKAEDGK